MRLLVVALLALSLAAATLLVVLIVRRSRRLRGAARRAAAADRLRVMGAALVMDHEEPPPLPPDQADLLTSVLWDYSRQITGSGRDYIGAYFEQSGLVDRQLRTLADRRAWLRAQAAFILGDACSTRAVPALADRLYDENPDVRAAAARSLGRLRATGAAGSIVEAVGDQRVPLGLGGAMLVELRAGAVPELIDLLHQPDARRRADGAELLGLTGSVADTDHLIPLLADRDPVVRARACLALGRLGAPPATPRLSDLLTDREPSVRAAAAEALGELQAPSALEDLLGHASGDAFDPAQAAARAAGRIDPQALLRVAARPYASPHLVEAASRIRAG